MASSNKGYAIFPSGIEVPTHVHGDGVRAKEEPIKSFHVLLEMLTGTESKGLDGTFEMRVAAEAFSVLKKYKCTPTEFFQHNIKENKNISPVTRKFLIETIDYLNGSRRMISASLFSELMEMPTSDTSKMANYKADVKGVKIPTLSNKEMVVSWLSKDGGLSDLLWSFKAIFG